MTPSERTHRARIAGLTRAARDPSNLAAARARQGLEDSWTRKARELYPYAPEWQVANAARALRKLHYQKLSRAGVEARAR